VASLSEQVCKRHATLATTTHQAPADQKAREAPIAATIVLLIIFVVLVVPLMAFRTSPC
jgi:hypothetical protein